MSWNVWNRPSGSFMVDMGISSNIMKSPSPKCYMVNRGPWMSTVVLYCWCHSDNASVHLYFTWHSGTWPYTMTPSIDQISHQYRTGLYYRFDLITKFWRFPYNIATGAASQQRTLTPCPVPFGTCICSNVETILSWTCHVYGTFEFRTSLGTSILLVVVKKYHLFTPIFLIFMTSPLGVAVGLMSI